MEANKTTPVAKDASVRAQDQDPILATPASEDTNDVTEKEERLEGESPLADEQASNSVDKAKKTNAVKCCKCEKRYARKGKSG